MDTFSLKNLTRGSKANQFSLEFLICEPTESQKSILEELKKQSTVLRDMIHWKIIIEL